MNIYLAVYTGSLLLVLFITPVVILLAHRFNIVDVPGARHMHTSPVSHVGGIAIFVSMMAVSITVLWLWYQTVTTDQIMHVQLRILLLAAGFIFMAGLIDDVKTNGLRARTKFIAQVAAALMVCMVDIRIKSIVITDSMTVDFGWFSWPLTLFWIVGITNAINLSDGLDGLAGGICAIVCGVMAVFAGSTGNMAVVILMLATLGTVTGFLFFNFNPAKIFMGDCGSMFLGFMIAASSVLCFSKSSALVGLTLPVAVLGIPIFDTLFSMLRRFLERRSIFSADRSHFHHKLIDLGLTQSQAVIAIYGVTLLNAGLGMFMIVTPKIYVLIVFFCILVLLLLIFHIVGSVRLEQIKAAMQKRYKITHREHEERKSFEEAALYFRRAATFDQWWQAVSTAAGKMEFWTVDLTLVNRDGTSRNLNWSHNGHDPDPDPEGLIQVLVPVRDRRSGSSLHLKITLYKNSSLESAGRRVALFTRLIEEYDINDLRMKRRNSEHYGADRTLLYT
ncbi:MAG: undecaprenyl/decaprenyl-phosphate alpha-N-acetylglucosaminyl 1-phosphate transferase [Sedimentisphaerales bacterium]|nr:undecaprenyl/decaprenyl-phosphate alpha-N-acetylglucosaminyl 1-phosphate transferase [Sedimentisphaerales bacterium]